MKNWIKYNLKDILNFLIGIGVFILLILFVSYNARIASVVKGQQQLLIAIKKTTTDNNLTTAQQSNLIICMLHVPVEQRSENVEKNCRKQAATSSTTATTTLRVPESLRAGPGQSSGTKSTTAPQNTPTNDSSGITTPKIGPISPIHIPRLF